MIQQATSNKQQATSNKPFKAGLLTSILLLSSYSHAQELEVQPPIELEPPHEGASAEWTETYWGFLDTFYPSPKPEGILDNDGDSIEDEIELTLELDPNDPEDAGQDSDLDQLNLAEELYLGTDDAKVDSNGNGVSDWDEVFIHRTNPMEAVEETAEPALVPVTTTAATESALPPIVQPDFSALPTITEFDKTARNTKRNQEGKFEWTRHATGEEGWQAHNGTTIEAWDNGVYELNGSKTDYGLKQSFEATTGTYKLSWKHRGRRNKAKSKLNNTYKLVITREVNGSEVPLLTKTISAPSQAKLVNQSTNFIIINSDLEAVLTGQPATNTSEVTISLIPTKSSKTLGTLVADIQLEKTSVLPVEVAPEVLVVNADFDEGRINPSNGYAIPDCDDIPGVDRKTGSGNTELLIGAKIDHLDSKYSKGELITEDMHKGWFGINPNELGDDFWDGATVTIRKVQKVDPETGRDQSGQIRFYAKWGEENGDFYGITPYNLKTLSSPNLVSGGVNKRSGEGVYGSSSTIPQNAEFWMEGVRPGKITLEWRLQKGNIDVKYEQTFLVATQKSKQEWLDEVYYQIKLQSTFLQKILQNTQSLSFAHALQAFPIDLNKYKPSDGLYLPQSRKYVYIQTIYYYYRQLFQQNPEELYWAGMAKTAGAAVYAGMVDMNTWRTWVFADHEALDKVLNDFMIQGNKSIFDDMAWAHHAYASSGIWALRYLRDQQIDDGTFDDEPFTAYEGWEEIDTGIKDNEIEVLRTGNQKILRREQEVVMQPLYNTMKDIWLKPNVDVPLASWFSGISVPPARADGKINIDHMFSINGKNPVHLVDGPSLRQVVPNGLLSSLDDRWEWIDNPDNGMLQIWLGTSKTVPGFNENNRNNLNSEIFWRHSALYSQLPTVGDFHLQQFPPAW